MQWCKLPEINCVHISIKLYQQFCHFIVAVGTGIVQRNKTTGGREGGGGEGGREGERERGRERGREGRESGRGTVGRRFNSCTHVCFQSGGRKREHT